MCTLLNFLVLVLEKEENARTVRINIGGWSLFEFSIYIDMRKLLLWFGGRTLLIMCWLCQLSGLCISLLRNEIGRYVLYSMVIFVSYPSVLRDGGFTRVLGANYLELDWENHCSGKRVTR